MRHLVTMKELEGTVDGLKQVAHRKAKDEVK